MRLSDVSKGTIFFIESMPCGEIRSQGIRLGLLPGAKAMCLSVLPGGPVVLLLGTQEIAVGRKLARRILISRWGTGTSSKQKGAHTLYGQFKHRNERKPKTRYGSGRQS